MKNSNSFIYFFRLFFIILLVFLVFRTTLSLNYVNSMNLFDIFENCPNTMVSLVENIKNFTNYTPNPDGFVTLLGLENLVRFFRNVIAVIAYIFGSIVHLIEILLYFINVLI